MGNKLRSIFILIFSITISSGFAQTPARKVYTTTPTYSEIIAKYEAFAKQSHYCKLLTYRTTDMGKPLHLLVISKNKVFDPAILKKQHKSILLINNGIHPGEPDGIDAGIELVNTLLKDESNIPEDVVICIIPVYNIGGCLNRGKYSRANQNGPEEYGFRGNGQNLDLNRDFIKTDSKNAKAFTQLFQVWKPDVFMDNHVSDGADYQYVMTLIATQRDKLNPILSKYMTESMLPQLYDKMKAHHYDLCPYVESKSKTPDSGIVEFLETPRYSSGYTTLFNCIGFIPETHMLKPYNDRVWATYELMISMIGVMHKDAAKIIQLHAQADGTVKTQTQFPLNWQLDTTKFDTIPFKGYEAEYKTSEVSGLPQLYYAREKAYTKYIRFYDHYNATEVTDAPAMYIISQAWYRVIDRLKLNNVAMKRLAKDTIITCAVKYITSYKTVKQPYEGHYLHYEIKTSSETQTLHFYKGDYLIIPNQSCNRYIIETLEPEGEDSFFAWNFFDSALQQKEWFSDYVFVDKAETLLMQNPQLRLELEAKRKSDTAFAKNNIAQLYYLYKHSPYFEKSCNRYPVARINR